SIEVVCPFPVHPASRQFTHGGEIPPDSSRTHEIPAFPALTAPPSGRGSFPYSPRFRSTAKGKLAEKAGAFRAGLPGEEASRHQAHGAESQPHGLQGQGRGEGHRKGSGQNGLEP